MTDIVNALLFRGGEVLLARRSAHCKAYANLWSFPGGHVEAGESLPDALDREMTEEIGVRPVHTSLLRTLPDPLHPAITYHMFAVDDWSGGAPKLIGDEHSKLAWFTFALAATIPRLALKDYRVIFSDLASRSSAPRISVQRSSAL
jgi:8-oxo-dGTP diphosphatase